MTWSSALATANIDGEQLTPAELASFFVLLVVAGQRDHAERDLARADACSPSTPTSGSCCWPTSTAGSAPAVEEIVRYVSPVIWMRRSVTRDCTLNGHDYREGDKVLLFYWAANRDESVFADAGAVRHHPLPQPARRVRRRGPALLPRRAPGPPGDHRDAARAADPGAATSAPPAEPDRLLSSFINGIKHLPCEID